MAQRDKARKQYETTCAQHKTLVNQLLTLQSSKPSNSAAAKDSGEVTSPTEDSKMSPSSKSTNSKPNAQEVKTREDIQRMTMDLANQFPKSSKNIQIAGVTTSTGKKKESPKKDAAKKKDGGKKKATAKKNAPKKKPDKKKESQTKMVTTEATANSNDPTTVSAHAAPPTARRQDRIQFSEYIDALENQDHVNHDMALQICVASSVIAGHPTHRPGAADIKCVNVLEHRLRQSPHPTCRYGMPVVPLVTHTFY